MTLTHDLIKHNSRHYECRACSQTWQSVPQTSCPGIRVYPKYDCGSLLTAKQLKQANYMTDKAHLPPPVACYYTFQGRSYVMLYDPAQATPNPQKPSRRRLKSVATEMAWPLSLVTMLDSMNTFIEDRALHSDRTYEERAHEIANTAAHLSAFTSAEIETMAGTALKLTIGPSLIRRSYPSFEFSSSEQIELTLRLVSAYKSQRETSQ